MDRIIIVDLSEETILEEEYHFSKDVNYGRGLALELLKKHTKSKCKRLDEGNALVFVPGILTGNKVPCATRGLVMAKGEGEQGLLVSSFTGDTPQKLASLHIAAIVIRGESSRKNMALYLDQKEIKLLYLPKTQDKDIPEMIEDMRKQFGAESAIWGVGKAADKLLPISTYFATYPEGEPRFSCPRNGFGDVAGSKGFRGLIVKEEKYFESSGVDKAGIQQKGKQLAKLIVQDKICGGALPGLGSITLLHILKNKEELPSIKKKSEFLTIPNKSKIKINTCCAPMCVIGCLNRHSSNSGEVYGAPAESEVRAALSQRFGEESAEFAKVLNEKGFALGIDTVEFVNTAAIYLKAMDLEPTQSILLNLLNEIERGTLEGRLLGGGTQMVSALYKERKDLIAMVTKPAVSKESQTHVKMEHFSKEMKKTEDLDLLYQQVFILENLGICIFSSFAILNHQVALENLAEIVSCKMGRTVSLKMLLDYAQKCILEEQKYLKENAGKFVQKSIPEFIKVLYSYFEK